MRLQFITLLLLVVNIICAQGQYDANWCFGIKAGINFSDTSNPVNFNTLCNEDYTGASISDSLGNLLFYIAPDSFFLYATGYYTPNAIYNRNNEIINNGDSIDVGYDLTSAIILPVPQTRNSYYFFYTAWYAYDYLRYGIITLDSGTSTYRVTEKNKVLNTLPLEWGLCAVKHANGNDWWLVVHQADSIASTNQFFTFLVTQDSVLGPFNQNIGSLHNAYGFPGQLKFSKDGNWLGSSLEDQNAVDLFNFDRCTGQLENFISLANIDSLGDDQIQDCEFSDNDTKLYISEGFGDISSKNAVYQYDLSDSNINSTKVTIFKTDSAQTTFGDLKRAPNNKIYLAVEYNQVEPYHNVYNKFNQYLWVINDPDSTGPACNFQPYGYYLGDSARVYWALPNMPNYNLGALSIYQGIGYDTTICNTDSITIGNPPVTNVTYAWQPASGITNTTLAQQTVKPDSSTWYYVTLTDTTINYSCQSVTDSFLVQVIVCCDTALLQQVSLSKDTFVCKGDSEGVILTANTVAGITFNWQAAPGINNPSLAQQTVNPTQSTWYYVTFTDSSTQGICAKRIDSVYVDVKDCCDTLLLLQCTLSKDTFICTNIDTPTKGAVLLVDTVPGVSYTWQPAAGITNVHAIEQIVDPSQSTWYYVTFFSDTDSSSACNQRKDSVYVEVKKCMVGIDEISLATQHLNIYPNPAQNIAVVEWQPVDGQLQIFITDLLGQEVSRFEADGMSGKTEMDISGLENGLYVVRLLSPAGGGVGGGSGKLTVIK